MTTQQPTMERAIELLHDPEFRAVSERTMGHAIVCERCIPADYPLERWIWEQAYSEARRERNPEMMRLDYQAEMEWVDRNCFGYDGGHRNALEATLGSNKVLTQVAALSGDTSTDVGDTTVNQLGHHFVIKNETGRKVPEQFLPDSEKFGRYAHRIAIVWARLLMLLHKIYGINDEFSIGFIFSDDVIAQHSYNERDGRVYYLNPCDPGFKKRYNYSARSGKDDQCKLKAIALHELVHGLGYSDHDEDYAAKLTCMMATLLQHNQDFRECFEFMQNK